MGSGQKMDRPKWVAQSMTLTQSFKGQIKTGLTRIFSHENKLDSIVQNYHLVFFFLSFFQYK